MKRVFVIISLVIVFFALQTFYRAGQFKTINDSFSGSVTNVYTNVPGPEDIQIDHFTNKLYISATERRLDNKKDNGIYVLNLEEEETPAKIETTLKSEFNPHGISLLRKGSLLYLFAINHNSSGDFIELFLVQEDLLNHIGTISTEEMCCPNDLVALDIDKVYISNDHGVKKGAGRIMEDYLRIPRSSIYYYNGEEVRQVAKPFHYANGVNLSPDKTKLYVAETTGNAINTFQIEKNGDLALLGSFDVGTGVDNIDIDSEGNLWVAAHPKLLDFVNHSKDSVNRSPSQVLKLSPISNYEFEVEIIFQNDGQLLSGSSTGVYYKNELLIGVVLDRSILRADL